MKIVDACDWKPWSQKATERNVASTTYTSPAASDMCRLEAGAWGMCALKICFWLAALRNSLFRLLLLVHAPAFLARPPWPCASKTSYSIRVPPLPQLAVSFPLISTTCVSSSFFFYFRSSSVGKCVCANFWQDPTASFDLASRSHDHGVLFPAADVSYSHRLQMRMWAFFFLVSWSCRTISNPD